MGLSSNFREWYLQIYDREKDKPISDSTGKYQVYTAASPVRQTIYSAAGAVLTQEVRGTSFLSRTMTEGKIRFFTATTCSSVDLTVLTAGGRSYFLKALTPSQHRVDVHTDLKEYMLVAAFNDRASCTTVRPIGFQMRKGMVIKDVFVKVVSAFAGAAAASNRYSVGRSGNALGFLNNLTLSSVGFKDGTPNFSATGFSLTNRYGADISKFNSSSTSQVDYYYKKNYFVATAVASNNLVVKRQTAATLTQSFTNTGVSGAGKAYVYYVYTLLPTE